MENMKTKIIKIAFFSLVVAGFGACSDPSTKGTNSKHTDPKELSIDRDSTDSVATNPESLMVRLDSLVKTDSLGEYAIFAAVIDDRYLENNKAIKEMKKTLKSEVNEVQMEYDQELYYLNKRNLEIKTKVKDFTMRDQKSWDDFRTYINDELFELEKSIRELAERAS